MNFNFKKKYGQNFLKDNKVINDIITSISPSEDDLIIEIGPGSGALTSELIKYNSHLLAYEVDTDLKIRLSAFESDKVHIIFDDFLNRDIKEDIKNIKFNNLYIVGNLPYYITTPIILKIIEENLNIKSCLFMVQKEVADRFSSKEGNREYGSISVLLNYYFDIQKLFIVKKDKFVPVPKVDSAVIKFDNKEKVELKDIKLFNNLVRDSFQFKRKNLKNNLKNYDLDKIDNILKEYNYSLNNRAEDLPYQVFIEIANRY